MLCLAQSKLNHGFNRNAFQTNIRIWICKTLDLNHVLLVYKIVIPKKQMNILQNNSSTYSHQQ